MREDTATVLQCGNFSDQPEIHRLDCQPLETDNAQETSVPHLRRCIVRHCSPTLAGLKCGSMFRVCSCPHSSHALESVRKELHGRGVMITIIRRNESGILLYVHRPSGLAERLSDPDTVKFLAGYGYPSDAESAVDHLKRRCAECDSCPPEIGIFLDYPLEDVTGYIENCGECCRTIGCWKVYGDVDSANARFALYRKCRRVYERRFSEGVGLTRLAIQT